MGIKNFAVDEKVAEVEYNQDPDNVKGFFVTFRYANREELQKMRDKSVKKVFNKKNRQMEEEVDNDKFLKEYTKYVIKDWRGLKYKHLPYLMPADISSANPEEEVPYSEEDAHDLAVESVDFDRFVTETANDLAVFNEEVKKEEAKNSENSSEMN